ncbi:MAG: hypothetical protein JSS72_10995 [Armatimonadetes bacterium]|nr:hypothetical protein [Armatimonadota bacterium]
MIARAIIIWLLLCVLAILNGAFREAILKPRLGERWAHFLSTLILSGVIWTTSFAFLDWIGATTLASAWWLGFGWLSMTLAFEFLAGHYVFKNGWDKLLGDYDASKGRVWLLVPACTLFAPPIAAHGLDDRWHWPHIISVVVAVVALAFSLFKPQVARGMIAFGFAYAGGINLWMALASPQEYFTYADFVIVPAYKDFILGSFQSIVTAMVAAIAIGQLLIAAALALGGRLLPFGVAGVVIFLLAIAPFGQGSAFPFSVLVSLAAVSVLGTAPSRAVSRTHLRVAPRAF